jgi:hypothetical protein
MSHFTRPRGCGCGISESIAMKHLGFAAPLLVLGAYAAAACGSARPTPSPLTEPAGPPPSYGWTPPVTQAPAASIGRCVTSGCEGFQCVEAGTETEVATPCEAPPEAKCLAETQAKCEVDADGKCGWTASPELTACLAQFDTAAKPPASEPGVIRLDVIHNQAPGMVGQVAAKPFVAIPSGRFPARPLQLRVGTFVYNVFNGQVRGVPAISQPTPATMVLDNGQEVPVELVRSGAP